MPGLSTIAIDTGEAIAPPRWTGTWVQYRLIEAYSTERRLPHPRRRALANAWPKHVVEFQDLLGRADDAREQVLDSWQHCDAGVSARDVSRMEAAHHWLLVILARHPQERLCLSSWAAAIAYRRSLRRLLVRRGWSRSTFYRYATAGALIIATELGRQGEPVV
jgi:hypothetical protein